MNTIIKVLDNGLKVAVHSFPQLQTVGIAFGVNFGSIDEDPRINGSAHFLEHMLFKGTEKRTWKDISDQIKELGVYNNAFTDHETTIYFMQAYKGHAEKTIDILSDIVKDSTIPENEFELERGPIINENLIRHDNPRFMISDYIPRALYKNHPARMSVGGDNEKTISKITRKDLLNIYKNYYNPANSVLTIYGGISSQKAISLASKYFGNFNTASKKTKRSIAIEKQERTSITVVRKGIKQTRIGIGFKCSEFRKNRTDEFLAMMVTERYLDDKLFDEIRQKKGLSYDPMAMYGAYSTFGFIAAAAGIEPQKSEEAKEIMLTEFKKLQNGEINKEDFERTKKALTTENKVRKESSISMAIALARFELTYGGSKFLEALPDLIKSVKIEDVSRYCGKYIDVDRYGMVLLKPS